MSTCQVCNTEFEQKNNKHRVQKYCSNACKFLDPEYNKSRGRITEKEPPQKLFKCPECDWGSNDPNNRSGLFTEHVKKNHGLLREFCQRNPMVEHLFGIRQKTKTVENYIKCEECQQYFNKLTAKHLLTHGLTSTEYKQKYNVKNMDSAIAQQKASTVQLDEMYKKLTTGDRIPNFKVLFTREEFFGVHYKNKYKFECLVCQSIIVATLDCGKIPKCWKCIGKKNPEIFNTIKIKILCKTCNKPTIGHKSYCSVRCQENDPNGVMCLICNKKFPHNRALGLHLVKNHKVNKIDYIKKYILNDVIPLCKCGCGQEIPIKYYEPYIVTEFITGHNSKGEGNPRYGIEISDNTRSKMIDKANVRIQYYRAQNIKMPMHSDKAIAARAKVQTDKFIDKVEDKYNVTVLEHCREGKELVYYKVECNTCKNTFEQYHQAYFRCYECFPRERSTYERELLNYITKTYPDIKVLHNCRQVLINNKELDFYFPEHDLAIEIDGLYYHSEIAGDKDSKYHLTKTKECEQVGIQLLHIFEDEWITQRDVIYSKISQKLYKFAGTKIMARKCIVKNISVEHKLVGQFLDKYHLQNKDMSSIKYGLYYIDELIAVMTFNKPNASRGHKNLTPDTYELSRFAVKYDVLCIGGAGKLLATFEKEYSPKELITYADRRYSIKTNAVYDKLGFIFETETPPSYWYIKGANMKRYHRFNFTKKKTLQMGGIIERTEWENMISLGYDRIWDCGTLRYRKIYR